MADPSELHDPRSSHHTYQRDCHLHRRRKLLSCTRRVCRRELASDSRSHSHLYCCDSIIVWNSSAGSGFGVPCCIQLGPLDCWNCLSLARKWVQRLFSSACSSNNFNETICISVACIFLANGLGRISKLRATSTFFDTVAAFVILHMIMHAIISVSSSFSFKMLDGCYSKLQFVNNIILISASYFHGG